MKRIIPLALFLFMGIIASAQNILEVKNISQPNDVYSSDDNEAAVIIRCHESIPLQFVSSMDKSATPFRTELQGSDSVYYIAFPTGNRYRGRELTIIAKGFTSVSIPLELTPKQLLSFQISDPNALVDAGCYREHRNKGMEEIKNSNYEEARNQFLLALECSDCNETEIRDNIARVDMLITWRKKGDEAFMLLDYMEASKYYTQILSLNSYDNYASNRNSLCVQNFTEECSTLFTKAEFYYSEKEFDKAKQLYERIIDRDCTRYQTQATERLNSINTNERSKTEHARVFTYEYRKDVPLGFSYGKYNQHKAGGFFQMDFNGSVFDALRSDCMYGDKKFAEMNMAFGWTVKIYAPVWIHFGPGFTGKMYYGTYADKKYPKVGYGEEALLNAELMGNLPLPKEPEEAYEDAWQKANYAFAISPVIGLTVKYSYFAIRCSYQYRWSLQKDLKDFVGTDRVSIGVGIAF